MRRTDRLRVEAAAYREIAAASKRGSREQITAANLASQADRRLASSMGVAAHEARTLAASSGTFDRSLSRATRGALAGSGIFRGLGRSIAFASGGFLAFASAGQFIRTSIDAAKEAQVTQKQLAAQFRASGKDVGNYQKQIDETANKLALLAGFTNDEVKGAFTTIFRTTGNVSKALRDTATASDLARAKHLSLAQAALIVAKTEAGNTTLLRRQGFEIAKHATAEQALAKLRQIVAGQAKAGTTQQERFGAVLHNTEEIIGAGLLPTLNQYLARGSVWLTQMNESGRLQRDVTRITHDLGRAFHDAGVVARFAADGIAAIDRVTGSAERTLKLFAETWLLFKARSALIRWGIIEAGVAGIGTKAAIASGEVTGLTAALTRLKSLGPIAVAVALSMVPKAKADQNPNAPSRNPVAKFFAGLPVVGGVFSQANRLADRLGRAEGLLTSAGVGSPAFHGRPKFPLRPFDPTRRSTPTPPPSPAARSVSLTGQFNLAELRLADAQRAQNVKLQRSILVSEEAIVLKLRDQAKTLKDRTKFAQQAAGLQDSIRSIDSQAAQKAAERARKRKQTAEKAALGGVPLRLQLAQAKADAVAPAGQDPTKGQRAAAIAIRNAELKAIKSHKLSMQGLIAAWGEVGSINQFLATQTSAAGVPLRLQLAQAKADAAAAASGAKDVTAGQMSVAKAIRAAEMKAIRSHKLSMQGLIDAWNTVATVNQQLASQAKSKGAANTYHHASTAALTRGLGLSHDATVAIRERAAQMNAHRGYVPSGPAAQGQAVTITGPIHVHGVRNVDQLYSELEKVAKRRGNRRGTR